ncbi:hypothetical protein Tco_0785008 [Tanacetum coccineum]
MFYQIFSGAARNWFDDLDLKSVDSFEELSQKFLEEFSQQKRCAKDPTKIHVIMEQLVKISIKARNLEFKRIHLKILSNILYAVKMDDPNITMEEYIRLEEENAHRSVFNDTLTSGVTLSCEPTVSPLNDNKIDFRISFDESDDEDYTVIYDKNSISNNVISINDLKTDSENDNDKVNMPSFPSPEPTVSYFDDLDYFKDFEYEFPAFAYNDALMSKLYFSEPTVSPQYIDEFEETSLSECDHEGQNVIYFNDLFLFNVIYPDDLSDKDNDNDKIDIEHSSG